MFAEFFNLSYKLFRKIAHSCEIFQTFIIRKNSDRVIVVNVHISRL